MQRREPKKPPPGFCKIHVDAGVRSRGGSAVAVCMDDVGNYTGSSALVIEGTFDPATLKAVACREALSLAEDLNIIISSLLQIAHRLFWTSVRDLGGDMEQL